MQIDSFHIIDLIAKSLLGINSRNVIDQDPSGLAKIIKYFCGNNSGSLDASVVIAQYSMWLQGDQQTYKRHT